MAEQTPVPLRTATPQMAIVPAEVPGLAGLLALAVGVVVVAALYFAREVLVPIMLAVLLSFVLAPLVNQLRRWHLPRVPAVLLTVLAAVAVMALLGATIAQQVAGLADDAPRYAASIERKAGHLGETTVGKLPQMLDAVGRQLDHLGGGAEPLVVRRVPIGTAARPMQVVVHQPAPTPAELLRSLLGPVVGPLQTTIIVLIVAIVILLQREDLRDRLIRLFGSSDLHRTTTAMDDAAVRLGRYFLVQLGLNAAFGVLIAVGLAAIGVPSPMLWGILAGLLRFVPYIGSFLSALPPLVLAAAVGSDWSMLLWTLALFGLGEAAMGYLVEPLVYGRSTGLSAAAVIVAAVFWTWLWGPVGLILSTPLTLCLVVLGRHFDRLEFLDILFGDRPALQPVESFYQRLLTGDPDQLLEQAEAVLKTQPLLDYYDDIAVSGLRLAAADATRGVLAGARLHRIEAVCAALFDDLALHVDAARPAEPDDAVAPLRPRVEVPPLEPPGRAGGAVLCIAARGPLDGSAATMIAQLLTRHGCDARHVTADAASRDQVAALDPRGVAAVVVAGLDLAAAAPRLRFLIRRLRAQLPDVPVIAALWTAGDAGTRDVAGADRYAATLGETVAAVAAIAGDAARAPPAAVTA